MHRIYTIQLAKLVFLRIFLSYEQQRSLKKLPLNMFEIASGIKYFDLLSGFIARLSNRCHIYMIYGTSSNTLVMQGISFH
jgi:hypothetical protein